MNRFSSKPRKPRVVHKRKAPVLPPKVRVRLLEELLASARRTLANKLAPLAAVARE